MNMRGVLLATCAFMASASVSAHSFGTLLRCENGEDGRCLWADHSGRPVDATTMIRQLMADEHLDMERNLRERERVETHVRYLEQVQRHAMSMGVEFPYQMGVNPRHLYLDDNRDQTPKEFVSQEWHAARRRRLEEAIDLPNQAQEREMLRRLDVPDSLNWCTSHNPLGKSVCTQIKSQSKCGSCWAFAATDAIEMAAGVAAGQISTALSPQQFLECSNRSMNQTYKYCWANKGVPGNTWLKPEMRWQSHNNACEGGMTHAAFQDAVELQLGILPNLYHPYNETKTILHMGIFGVNAVTTVRNMTGSYDKCNANEGRAAASISSWSQAVGLDCSQSSDATTLLKMALQKSPISVAIDSEGAFKDYKGGIYECPNNGALTSGGKIDHAVVLVGYGTSGGTGYWIIRNSYGPSWGDQGYVNLKMDDKVNCGLNVFPVVPGGAKKFTIALKVDGGGDKTYIFLTPNTWLIMGFVITIGTVAATAFGLTVARQRREEILAEHKQSKRDDSWAVQRGDGNRIASF